MRLVLGQTSSSSAIRLAVVGVAAALLAGCSSDATRFASNPFSTDPEPTASIPQERQSDTIGTGPIGQVSSQPLSPVSSSPLAAPSGAPVRSTPQALRPAPVTSNSTSAVMNARGPAGWSAEGGTPIAVGPGETAAMIASRYGVPQDALLRANGFTSASQIHTGTRLVVPVFNGAGGHAAATPMAPAKTAATPAKIMPTRAAPASVAMTQAKTTEKLNFVKGADASAAKGSLSAQTTATAKLGSTKTEATKLAEKPAQIAKPVAEAAPVKSAKQSVAAAPVAPAASKADQTASIAPETSAPAAESDKPEFRWPARGRIIQGFKTGGNDGINIAVPEGTAVKAAEAGTVVYAGNDVKGYGNMILIRHPNGFVSAYANNGEINVKRGESVKRGQSIAKSGQTGNVASPQLHFELRKGTTPVDPTQYLAGL